MNNLQNTNENVQDTEKTEGNKSSKAKSALWLSVGGTLLVAGGLYYASSENSASTATKATEEGKAIFHESSMDWNKETSYSCHMEGEHSCSKEFEVTKPIKNLTVSVKPITWKHIYAKSDLMVSLWKDELGKELITEKSFPARDMIKYNIFTFTLEDVNIAPGEYVISCTSNETEFPFGLAADKAQLGQEYMRDDKHIQNSDLKILITE